MSLKLGRFPCAPPVGCDGWADDEERLALGGLLLVLKACCIRIKGDWYAFANVFGFPTWASRSWPCLACDAEQDSLYVLDDTEDVDEFAFNLSTTEQYDAACSHCEIRVVIDTMQKLQEIRACLVYDRRKKGIRGLSLKVAFPDLGLAVGDRVEPSQELPDHAILYSINDIPQGGWL